MKLQEYAVITMLYPGCERSRDLVRLTGMWKACFSHASTEIATAARSQIEPFSGLLHLSMSINMCK